MLLPSEFQLMKRTFFLFAFMVASVAMLQGCKGVKKTHNGFRKDPYANFANAIPGDTLFASIERQPCFGTCPIYKIRVFKSGYVVYDAVKWVAEEGTFHTTIGPDKMQEIYDKAKASGYFEMNDAYNNKMLTDLPVVITSVHAYQQNKRIKNRYQAPAKLKEYEAWLDDFFAGMDWKPLSANDR